MKTTLIILIISICICTVSFIISGFTYKSNILKDYKTMQKCTEESRGDCKDEENCCTVWDPISKSCRKGKIHEGECKWSNNIVPFIFASMALFSIVVIIIVLLICLGECVTGEKITYQ